MPLDPQARFILAQLDALGEPPLETQEPAEARALREGRPRPAGPDVSAVEDLSVPGPDGAVPVRVFTPTGQGPFPVLVWFHGGGWVLGDLEMSDATCRNLTNAAGCVVVSVDYRLAPEAKFPAAPEDCYAATRWVAENADRIGVDTTRIAVGGDSAGGNLAAVVAQMCRDRGGPSLMHQLLVYPVIEHNLDTPSYQENKEGYLLSHGMMEWFWGHYLGDESEAEEPYAAPIKAKDLSGLPAAHVITAEFDPLRDEGETYAQRLMEAGVPTRCERYDGMIHGFFGMSTVVDKSKTAIAEASKELRKAFGT
jgi:acetyl esterase